jgi:hypothetical protein
MTSNTVICRVCQSTMQVDDWLRHGCHGGVVIDAERAWVDATLRRLRKSLLDAGRIQVVAEDLGVSEAECRIALAHLTQELAEATGR